MTTVRTPLLLCSQFSCKIASIHPFSTTPSGGSTGEDEYSVDFISSQAATASKSNYELIRGWFVFNVFNNDHLVDNSLKYYNLAKRNLGSKTAERILKATVFGQFAGGLNEREVKRTVRRLADAGVTSIWNYSTEKDLHEEGDITTEEALAEKERGFCEVNDKYLKSIKMSAAHNCDRSIRLAAVKLTAIVNTHLVKKINEMLVTSHSVFNQLATTASEQITSRTVSMDTLKKELPALLDQGLEGGERGVSVVQWNNHFCVAGNMNRFKVLGEKANVPPDTLSLSSLELKQLDGFLDKLDSIGKCASDHGVRVLVDAEQTYFQRLFDHLTLHYLMARYNREQVTIYNTVQAYLKNAMETLLLSLATTADHSVNCGIKLVRGAYMEQERQLAGSQGRPSPIHPTKEATDASYNSCLTHLLDTVPSGQLCAVVASHNQHSVELAIQKMRELKLSKTDGSVAFGQLLGMGDYLSYPLAKAGYIVSKVLAYGTMDDVVPFLSRRAQENRSLMAGADRERKIYQQEIKRRLSSS